MGIFLMVVQLILSLAILVTLHEFGHYIAAKMFKTRVEKFYLFFNPWFSIYKKKIGETEWGLGWLPLGGYVKISGMIDESMDTEQMKQEPQPWEFRSKPAWQRLIIMMGGIIVNLILGFVIYIFIFWGYGRKVMDVSSLENGYSYGEVLQKYGFENGDRILSMSGEEFKSSDDAGKSIMLRNARNFEVLKSDGTVKEITLPKDVEYEIFATEGMQTVQPRIYAAIGGVVDTLEAGKKGVKEGDIVIAVNGEAIQFWDEMTSVIKSSKGKDVTLTVLRESGNKDIVLNVKDSGIIGVASDGNPATNGFKTQDLNYGFGSAISAGTHHSYHTLRDYIVSLKFIFTKKGAESLGGVGTIAKLFSPDEDKAGKPMINWQAFWTTTAFLSFMLAFLNFLPIPALDGGHVMFTLVEMVSGRKLPEKFMEYAQMFGIILLLGLMLYANGMDIFRALK
jgi:regulator of sigma E protease